MTGTPFDDWVDRFGPDTDWPENLSTAPLIVDIPIGSDPHDALALAAVARTEPQLALVVTSAETGANGTPGERARFARWLLDELGRPDIAVAAGKSAQPGPSGLVDRLVPAEVQPQPTDVVAAVTKVCATTAGPVRWVGLGCMTNLATVIGRFPELGHRFRVIQLETVSEHDLAAFVLAGPHPLPPPEIITAEVASDPAIVVDRDSELYRLLAMPQAPTWAAALSALLDRWFSESTPGSRQSAALALSAALDLPFVLSADAEIAVDGTGRIRPISGEGTPARVSQSAFHQGLMAWLIRSLDPDRPAVSPGTGGVRSQ